MYKLPGLLGGLQMSKVSHFLHLPEKVGVLLFSFGYGAFFGVLPVSVDILAIRAYAGQYRINPTHIYATLVAGTMSLFGGYLWHKRRASLGTVSRYFSIFLWGFMWALAAIVIVALALIPPWRGTALSDALPWALIGVFNFVPWSFAYGCLVGFLASYLLKFRFRDLVACAFFVSAVAQVVSCHWVLTRS